MPPHVEYDLTPAGATLTPALNALHDWAADGGESSVGAVGTPGYLQGAQGRTAPSLTSSP
ncbi:winged helix-turn-helix transcriptional regulator [Nonomuraea antimicrobica]